ncbi:MAG: sugar ABC transporter permease [Cyanobacteriota bacterium]|nr:sugar ABC transporter permease [Cyanobacteriota bacterium]
MATDSASGGCSSFLEFLDISVALAKDWAHLKKWWGWVLPAGLWIGLFGLYPMVQAVVRSGWGEEANTLTWVGLTYYQQAWRDPSWGRATLNSLIWVITAVPLEISLGLGLGWLLHHNLWGMRWLRALLLSPLLVSSVVTALIWKLFYHPDLGLLSLALRPVGIPIGQGLTAEPSTALLALLVVDIWQWTPLVAITMWAGLSRQDLHLLEAAQLEGANDCQIFLGVSLPLLRPLLDWVILLRTLEAFKVFEPVLLITGGGPGNATEVLHHYIFKVGLVFFDLGYASALSVLFGLLIAGVASLLVGLLHPPAPYRESIEP